MNRHEEIKTIIKKIMTPFTKQYGFTFYKPTLLIREYKDTIHIINFDLGTAGFTCDIAIQPLYIPSDTIDLSFGNRLSKFKAQLKERWPYEEIETSLAQVNELLVSNAIPWFNEVGTPNGIVSFLEKWRPDDFSIIVGFPPASRYLYLGFSYLYIGNNKLADKALQTVFDRYKDDKRDWAIELKQIISILRELLKDRQEEIHLKLKEYIDNNCKNLRLKKEKI